jgi:hypothetical protein
MRITRGGCHTRCVGDHSGQQVAIFSPPADNFFGLSENPCSDAFGGGWFTGAHGDMPLRDVF